MEKVILSNSDLLELLTENGVVTFRRDPEHPDILVWVTQMEKEFGRLFECEPLQWVDCLSIESNIKFRLCMNLAKTIEEGVLLRKIGMSVMLKDVPVSLRTFPVCLAALNEDVLQLPFVPADVLTLRMCEKAQHQLGDDHFQIIIKKPENVHLKTKWAESDLTGARG